MNEPTDVIWRWTPEKKEKAKSDPHDHDDIAEEYAIERCESADSGVILWGKYHNKWHVNPWNARPVIAKLLSDCGLDIPVPRR